jgi:aspartate aminotransferase-like enzyme
MAAWLRVLMGLVVLVMPGGFVLALAYALARVLREGWRTVQQRAPEQGVTLRALLAEVRLAEVVRVAKMH